MSSYLPEKSRFMTITVDMPISYRDGPTGHSIPYELRTGVKDQPRVKPRAELTPMVNLSDYNTRAVFDWIELRVFLRRETTWKSVQHAVEKHYGRRARITGPNGEKNHKGEQFRIRLHDPVPRIVEACMDEIESRHGFAHRPELHSIEISLDWYSISGRTKDRNVMVALLLRHFIPPEGALTKLGDQARCFSKKHGRSKTNRIIGYSEKVRRHLDLNFDQTPFVDGTTYFGAKHASAMWRIMNKIKDCQNPEKGEYVSLTEKQSRARIEVCLQAEPLHSLGLKTLDDLRGFNFDSLRTTYFQFKLATTAYVEPGKADPLKGVWLGRQSMELERFMAAGVYGVNVLQRGWLESRFKLRDILREEGLRLSRRKEQVSKNGLTVAFREMNKRAQNAFSRLKWCP